MMKMNIIKLFFLLFAFNAFAEDLSQGISSGNNPDLLAPKPDEERTSPFAYKQSGDDNYHVKTKQTAKDNFVMGTNEATELEIPDLEHKKLKGSGYEAPGSFEHEANYMSLDKEQFAKSFRKKATSTFTISYLKDSFQYQSTNDVITRTISEGYQHVQAGMLQLRSDQYFAKTFALNLFWTLGTGVSYNSGKGTFVTGTKSETKLSLWEVPVDIGIGFEVPVYKWFKFVGAAGPSGMILAQNRNDFSNDEKGKNKYQFSYGEFMSGQFKLNLTGFSDGLAYDLFSASEVTNFSVNLEARFENYQNFQDADLGITGTSVGIGFTFEFL